MIKKRTNGRAGIRPRDGFLIVTVIWLLAGLIGTLPFLISGVTHNFIDAFFESCSGFTTTGATVFEGLDEFPKWVLFWRAFSQWLGGMGIIVFVTALIPSSGIKGQLAAYAETPGPSKGKFTARFSDSARDLYLIYLLMTILLILLLKLGNISWFDAVTHAFSTMGTGGFSNYDAGTSVFSPYIQVVLAVFMFMAGVNFNLYYMATKRGVRVILRDEEFRLYLKIVIISSLLIFIYNLLYRSPGYGGNPTIDTVSMTSPSSGSEVLLSSFFHVISVITTTGFCSEDFDSWPTFSRMILFTLFFVGGCASSTGGGVKVSRILICLKLIKRSFSLRLHPSRIANVTMNAEDLPTETVIRTTGFVFMYAVTLFFGTLLISWDNKDFITDFTAAASCLANIGPGFGLVGPSLNYGCFGGFAKLVCAFLMIVGRLELYTVFVLFSKYYRNPNRS